MPVDVSGALRRPLTKLEAEKSRIDRQIVEPSPLEGVGATVGRNQRGPLRGVGASECLRRSAGRSASG
jgi:hypothetical protein